MRTQIEKDNVGLNITNFLKWIASNPDKESNYLKCKLKDLKIEEDENDLIVQTSFPWTNSSKTALLIIQNKKFLSTKCIHFVHSEHVKEKTLKPQRSRYSYGHIA